MSERTATLYTESLAPSDARLRCQLVVIDGPDRDRAARIESGELIVGTDPDCALRLTDERVSARHLSLSAEQGRFRVRDLGSKNGTLYEGSRITEALVPVGAALKLGRSFLRITPIREAVTLQPSQSRRFGDLVAESLVMREVFAVLELAAESEVTVLLEGETGTGKELAARALHEAGPRRRGPFVAVDCGALPESLLESELFGHVRGAFTGAVAPRAGAFARADRGTIFLDELATISPAVQARLLRVLEERRIKPVGSDEERSADVRVVAAAREDLEQRVAQGTFRADLFYRLSVLRVALPPLRARREDVAPIVAELMKRRGVAPGAVAGPNLQRLYAHDWPGNVRELRNVIDRALALTPGARDFSDLKIALTGVAGLDEALTVRSDLSFAEAKEAVLHAFERRYLADLIQRTEGNVSAAARESDLDRKHLRRLLRRHDLIADPADDSE